MEFTYLMYSVYAIMVLMMYFILRSYVQKKYQFIMIIASLVFPITIIAMLLMAFILAVIGKKEV